MEPFTTLTGIAAPLPIANIDTDLILSARFLKTVSRAGLGDGLMYAARFDDQGQERPEFILNREPWRHAKILVALDNFGCGSSREHAPWALGDFGIRCVIAPSFAEIFYNNCIKNGILPIILPQALIHDLMGKAARPETANFHINLPTQTLEVANTILKFEIDCQQRERLMLGIDDISKTLTFISNIDRHEIKKTSENPWLDHCPSIDSFL